MCDRCKELEAQLTSEGLDAWAIHGAVDPKVWAFMERQQSQLATNQARERDLLEAIVQAKFALLCLADIDNNLPEIRKERFLAEDALDRALATPTDDASASIPTALDRRIVEAKEEGRREERGNA